MVVLELVGCATALGVIVLMLWWPGRLNKFNRTCLLCGQFLATNIVYECSL